MKRIIILLFVLGTIKYACMSDTSNSSSTNYAPSSVSVDTSILANYIPSPVTPPPKVKTLVVYDEDGERHNLQIEPENTLYCAMATWCPHSKQLIDNINNINFSDVFNKDKIVFLFDRNELKKLIKKLQDHMTGMSDYEIRTKREELIELNKTEILYDRKLLSEIPDNIKVYYYGSEVDELVNGYPDAYSNETKSFSVSPYQWIVNKKNNLFSLVKKMDK